MQFKTIWNLLAVTLFMSVIVAGQSVEIVGSLQDTNRDPLSGAVDIITDGPDLRIDTLVVGNDGQFSVTADSRTGILIHASAENHPPDERYIQPGSTGITRLDFVLPMAQDLTGRVVDSQGQGIAFATVQVRYYEPDRPWRRTAFHELHSTDVDGYFILNDIGIGVPFFVDVYASGYRPVASPRTVRMAEDTQLEDIAITEEGGTVLVRVLDPSGSPATDVRVVLLADPAGYRPEERGSLLLSQAFHQQATTSQFGNARFAGVPAGRIRLHAISVQGEAWLETHVSERQRLEVALDLL